MSPHPLSPLPRTLVRDAPGSPGQDGMGHVPTPLPASRATPVGADLDNLASAPGVVPAVWAHFPSPELVGAAAALFTPDTSPRAVRAVRKHDHPLRLDEHPRTRIEIAPGVVRVRRYGYAAPGTPTLTWDQMQAGETLPDRSEITSWSPKSRTRMLTALASLDYAPMFASGGTPAMLTTTLPGDWQAIAPTGKAFKRLVKRLFDSIDETWGNLPLVWKLEFQRRGAPHVHAFAVVPPGTRFCRCRVCGRKGGGQALTFRVWFSHRWAAICAAPDPDEYARHLLAGTGIDYREGLRASDPKRLAVYFAKHGGAGGGKEYQHQVPSEWVVVDQETGEVRDTSGPGRFWGVRHLDPCWAGVDVAPGDADRAVRIMRRWSERQAFRYPGQTYPHAVELRTRTFTKTNGRKSRRRVRYVRGSAGFVLPNDGPAFGSQLARALEAQR